MFTISIAPQYWPAEALLDLLSPAFDGLHDDIKNVFLPEVIKEMATAW